MNALILAGGFGTRMHPVSKNTPKAFLEINNKKIIDYNIDSLKNIKEIKKIYILSNAKFYNKFLEWKTQNQEKNIFIINNQIMNESEKLGAIGDTKLALSQIEKEDLLILASDNFFNLDLNELIKFGKENNSSCTTLKKIENTELIRKYSCVIINPKGKIEFFEEKPKFPVTNLVSVAIYFIIKKDIKIIQKNTYLKNDGLGNIIDCLVKNSQVYGKILDGFWFDVGSKEELKNAELFIKTQNKAL